MNAFDSLILRAAASASVPAGNALAVEREKFSATITEILGNHRSSAAPTVKSPSCQPKPRWQLATSVGSSRPGLSPRRP